MHSYNMPKKFRKWGEKIDTSINSYLYFEMLSPKDISSHVLACSYFFTVTGQLLELVIVKNSKLIKIPNS